MQAKPMEYASRLIQTMMRRYPAAELPPAGHFHYHQGVFLSGVWKCGILMQEQAYLDYVKAWVDSCIDADGRIRDYNPGQMDDLQPGILLFPLLERTGDERYRRALDSLAQAVLDMPKNSDGGNWHKAWHEHQMWLDGLYMGGPLVAAYGDAFGRPEYLDFVVRQVELMREHTRDAETGLWCHAYDDARKQPWADPETGRSPEFWGRSIGWVTVAILDDLEHIPAEHPGAAQLRDIETDLLRSVARYQAPEGRWYQVVDKGDRGDNWLENSCSCLFSAAFARAVRRGLVAPEYRERAERAFDAVCASMTEQGEDLLLGGVCVGTGVGDYPFYVARPTSVNDLHGVGAFLLLCAALEELA